MMDRLELTGLVATFAQDEDTASSRDGEHYQDLTVELIYQGTFKEGPYISIKTDRWSVDDPDELKVILRQVLDAAKVVGGTETAVPI